MKFEILEALFSENQAGQDFFDRAYESGKLNAELVYSAESKCHSQFERQHFGFNIKFIK